MIDVIIVGAGPAGIAAAHAVQRSRPGLRTVLVDAGRSYDRRYCPVDQGGGCRGCGGTCNVVSGFGGSMHYGDGVKLSLLPSGRRLIDLFGDAEAHRLAAESFDYFTNHLPEKPRLVGHEVASAVLETFAAHDLTLRQYPVAVLGETQLRRALEGMYDDLSRSTDIRFDADVVDVARGDAGFEAVLRSRTRRVVRHENLSARAVIFATGRRGVTGTQKILRHLGITMRPPSLSVGVRFEMLADHLRATGLSHPDVKVTQHDVSQRKVKTFCFCGGSNGGRIKYTHYQGAFGQPIITLDGHETLEREPSGRPLAGNFGLLCQAHQLDDDADRSRTLQDDILRPYRDLNGGRPVVQTFAEFKDRRDPRESWEDMEASLPFDSSVKDLSAGPVHALFDNEQHASLVRGFENVMSPMLELNGLGQSVERLGDEVLVLGLELEFLWSRVDVDANTEANQANIFVVGDAAGLAQGIVQAMMMGRKAGEVLAGRLADNA